MYTLNDKTKESLSRTFGMAFNEIVSMDLGEEIAFAMGNNKKRIGFSPIDSRKRGRGSPLLAKGRECSIQNLNKRLKKIR